MNIITERISYFYTIYNYVTPKKKKMLSDY